jgi:DNA-directed RNA polymerase subunit M/transcription elongation factor TFIIS
MPPKKAATTKPTTAATTDKGDAPRKAQVADKVQALVFSAKGDIKNAKLALETDGTLKKETIQAYLKKKAEPAELGHYTYEGTKMYLFGYKEGKSGTENKTELPPPYDSLVSYGDMLLIATSGGSWRNPIPYTEALWNTFKEAAMGGFDEIGGGKEEADGEEIDEDEEELEEDEDVDVEDDEGVVDDEDGGSMGGGGGMESEEEEERPVPKAESRRKKAAAAASGYQRQAALLGTAGFKELVGDEAAATSPIRQASLQVLSFLGGLGFPAGAAAELERGIYIYSFADSRKHNVLMHWENPLFRNIYGMQLRTVVSNLHPQSPVKNPRILERIRSGELTFEQLGGMTAQEMFPENWKQLADRMLLREQKQLEGNKEMATDRFKCGQCKKRECTYYEMQTRSADEPMTIFITCLNCGKRWRQ